MAHIVDIDQLRSVSLMGKTVNTVDNKQSQTGLLHVFFTEQVCPVSLNDSHNDLV